jgi:hypothetical protein
MNGGWLIVGVRHYPVKANVGLALDDDVSLTYLRHRGRISTMYPMSQRFLLLKPNPQNIPLNTTMAWGV